MEGHAGDQRLDFLTGYWTLYVLMSWTVFSKILELVNMLQSSKSTCKSRRRDHTDTEYQRGNHWLHQALQPALQFPRSPCPLLPSTHSLPPPVGPLGLEAESESLLRWPPSSSCRIDVSLLPGLPVLGAHPLSSLSQQAWPLSPAFSLPPSQCPSVFEHWKSLPYLKIPPCISQKTSSLYYPGWSYLWVLLCQDHSDCFFIRENDKWMN